MYWGCSSVDTLVGIKYGNIQIMKMDKIQYLFYILSSQIAKLIITAPYPQVYMPLKNYFISIFKCLLDGLGCIAFTESKSVLRQAIIWTNVSLLLIGPWKQFRLT